MSKPTVNTTSQNKQILYRFLHENGASTRQAILVGTGLSLPTITSGISHLSAMGLVGSSDSIRNTGGRSAVTYACLPGGRYAIGLFFTVHHITAVLVDMMGKISKMIRVNETADLHSDHYLRRLGELARSVQEDAGISKELILGAGVAVQSLVSEDGEHIEFGMTQDFSDITRTTLSRYIPYPVSLFHDARSAGFAEVWSRPDLDHAFYLSLNDVVGGAFITNGRELFNGGNHRAAEIGHIIVKPGGEKCYCGQRGCFNTVCRSTVLDSYTKGDLDEFFRLLKAGDAGAAERFERYLRDLAPAVHNIRMLLDCPVILGGYVGAYLEDYMPALFRLIDGYMNFGNPAGSFVLPCGYRNEAVAAGAAIRIIDAFITSL